MPRLTKYSKTRGGMTEGMMVNRGHFFVLVPEGVRYVYHIACLLHVMSWAPNAVHAKHQLVSFGFSFILSGV